jgi:glycosyltransferase involved in cell wall biosynthesis
MTTFDVVIPCYNYGHFLEGAVRSVLQQSINRLRVLIIDDASSDNTLAVASYLATTDSRISIISHSQNLGHIQTYNEGISWASSDYFILLSADDLLAPGALERAANVMDGNSDIVLTHGTGISWDDSLPLPRIDERHACAWTRQDLVEDMCAVGANIVTTPTAIGRTAIQKRIGGYRQDLPHSGDMEMWLRYGAHGFAAKLNAVQAIYRRHAGNMSNAYYNRSLSDLPERKAAFDSFFSGHMDIIPRGRKLRARAYRMLAQTALRHGIGRFRHRHFRDGIKFTRLSMLICSELCCSRVSGGYLQSPRLSIS